MTQIRVIVVATSLLCGWYSRGLALGPVLCGNGLVQGTSSCPPGGCSAALLTCGSSQVFASATTNLRLIEGVCEDGTATPCADRFRYYAEACAPTALPPYLVTEGGLESRRSAGRFRICYDPSGAGDCTGATPAGIVILSGTTSIQQEWVPPGDANVPLSVFALHRVTQRKAVRVAGRSIKLSMKLGMFTALIKYDTSNCGGGGCGGGGCLVQLQ